MQFKAFTIVTMAIVCSSLIGCGSSSETESLLDLPETGGIRSIAVQLNWYPEAEHGGVYQADIEGIYRQAGLKVDIRPGGRATPVAPELELERVQFAFANADDVVIYRRQGLDVVAIAATMQNSPRCILVQEASAVKTFNDLKGVTLQRQVGRPFLDFMRSRGVLDGVKEVPYHGSVASLVADPNVAIQAYSFAEPLLAEQQGVSVRRLMVSDLGWNPYASVLITTGKLIREQPELVRDFVHATCQGWTSYLTDSANGNSAILAANEHGMTAEALEYGVQEMRPLVTPDNLPLDQVGRMKMERWQELVTQMDAISPEDAGKVVASDCFNASFLPKASESESNGVDSDVSE